MKRRTKVELIYVAGYLAMVGLCALAVCWRFANWTANYPQFNK